VSALMTSTAETLKQPERSTHLRWRGNLPTALGDKSRMVAARAVAGGAGKLQRVSRGHSRLQSVSKLITQEISFAMQTLV